MGERKAVNKYYPPDWTPDQGSLDRYHGQHPLRERARKLGQGILIIRFEMPYNIWCGGCGNHIGMGVRYNAEKKKVGNYYTTPIYRFRMKCHLCDNHFEIETDPKNCDYVIVSGARRKEERWEPSATETVELTDREDAKKMAADPMYKLEHGVKDEQKSKAAQPTLGQLQEVQSIWKDDYAANQLLRKTFRERKHEVKAQEKKDSELKERGSLDVTLVPERVEDIELAKKIRYHGGGFDEHRRKRRLEVNSRPMFDPRGKTDEKREKIKQLLGKRKQMQLNPFLSPSKGNNELIKLGIKVRRNSSTNSENSELCANKGPANEHPVNEDPAMKDSSKRHLGIKDPATENLSIEMDSARTVGNLNGQLSTLGQDTPASGTPDTNRIAVTDVGIISGSEVTSPARTHEGNDNRTSFSSKRRDPGNEVNDAHLKKQSKEKSEGSLISLELEMHRRKEQNGYSKVKTGNSAVTSSSLSSLVCSDYTDSSDASDDPS